MCPFAREKKAADITFLTCVCGEYRVLPIWTPTFACIKCLYIGTAIKLSKVPPTPLNMFAYSGEVYKSVKSLRICFPNLGILPICSGSKIPTALASSAVLNNHPFFKPDALIKSKALLFAIAEIISDVV